MSDAAERLAAAGSTLQPTDVPGATGSRAAHRAALAEQGVVYVQDAGSQLVARLAEVRGLWLDACAAPGGKSLSMADAAAGAAVIAAAKPRRAGSRCWRGSPRAGARAGVRRLRPTRSPRRSAARSTACCSTLRAAGSARSRAIRTFAGGPTPTDLARHAERQRAMLEAWRRLVRPGGQLVYATCSLEPEETREVVDAFLARDGRFVQAELPPGRGPSPSTDASSSTRRSASATASSLYGF